MNKFSVKIMHLEMELKLTREALANVIAERDLLLNGRVIPMVTQIVFQTILGEELAGKYKPTMPKITVIQSEPKIKDFRFPSKSKLSKKVGKLLKGYAR